MEKITENTSIEEIVDKYPSLVKVFIDFEIPCLVCGEAIWGTVGETARRYDVKLETLLAGLNRALNSQKTDCSDPP